MKAAELTGADLDYWVAKAEGVDVYREAEDGDVWHGNREYRPSTDWGIGGPIIEREGISIHRGIGLDSGRVVSWWEAHITHKDEGFYTGRCDTPLIAAMRAYVASRYGDEVSYLGDCDESN